jgi:hypothetical protein
VIDDLQWTDIASLHPPWVVPDGLWARIEPLSPVVPRRADHPGRRRPHESLLA